ncbi:hypothetical protein H0H93_014188 [Arthromyces matolae]|nr:hypothetical protein H0H93_014188 [Arthromyces matolae]
MPQGCKVYATSRKVDSIGDFAYPSVEKLALDVNDDAGVENAIKHIVEKEGQIDIVVNNAGYFCCGPLIDQTMDDVKANFNTNTFAIIRMAKAVIPHMAQRRSGVIVNVVQAVQYLGVPFSTRWDPIQYICQGRGVVHTSGGFAVQGVSSEYHATDLRKSGAGFDAHRGVCQEIGVESITGETTFVLQHGSAFDGVIYLEMATEELGSLVDVENVFKEEDFGVTRSLYKVLGFRDSGGQNSIMGGLGKGTE